MHELPSPQSFIEAEVLQRYELLECLGSGGMGWVYRAVDTYFDDHEIALKIFYPHLVRNLDTLQFEAEALIARKLTHPKIVQVYNYHRYSDEVALMSMEIVDGKSIADMYSIEKDFSAENILDITVGVASGIAFAHRSGVLHRDIKPDNVLLTRALNAKVADFGIAQLIADNECGNKQKMIGTPQFMSPEQFNGSVLRLSSDVYSFGCLLYFIIHKRPPFLAKTIFELAEHHSNSAVPIDSLLLRQHPPWIKELLITCTEKSPANRFESMEEALTFISTHHSIEEGDHSKASLQSFNPQISSKQQLPHVPENSQPTARLLLKLLFCACYLPAICSLFSNDIGYFFATILFTLTTLGLYCRQSIRIVNTIAQLFLGFCILVYYNPYSRTLACAVALDLEESTGIELSFIKQKLGFQFKISEPASLVENHNTFYDYISLSKSKINLDVRGHRGETILHNMRTYSTKHYKSIVDRIANLNHQDNRGRTPLFMTLVSGNLLLAKDLLQRGVDPNLADNNGVSPLSLAVQKQNINTLLNLLQQGADPNVSLSTKVPETLLEYAIEKQSRAIVRCLVRFGAKVRRDDNNRDLTTDFAKSMNRAGVFYHEIIEFVNLSRQSEEYADPQTHIDKMCAEENKYDCACI